MIALPHNSQPQKSRGRLLFEKTQAAEGSGGTKEEVDTIVTKKQRRSSSSSSSSSNNSNSSSSSSNVRTSSAVEQSTSTITTTIVQDTQQQSQHNREQNTSELIRKFRFLDSILNEVNQRGRITTWKDIERSFESLDVSVGITTVDLECMLEIFPTAYSMFWRTSDDAAKSPPVLCVTLNQQAVGAGASRALNSESRIRQFRDALDDWYSCHPESDSVVSSCSHIPPIPVTTNNINENTTGINSKRAGYTASAIASIALEKRKNGHEQDHALLSGGLEGLRHLAEMRERNKDQNEAEKRKEKSDGELRTRLVSICVLCDALRSKCMMSNRASVKTTDIINQLSKELSILPKELMIRLQLLTSIVPEYLTIVQPDNLVSYSVVRFNMQASYDQVRKKLASYATTTLSKLT